MSSQLESSSTSLAVLDALANALLARAAPVHFARADSASEREAVYRLRYATVVEEGWAAPADYPDGLEQDVFDEHAIHIIGRHDDQLVAVARLVFPRPDQPLPTEQDFNLTVQPPGGVVDIGRAIVVKEYRSTEHTLFGALLARCWQEIRSHGYINLCGAATARRLERYHQFGLPLRIIGPIRHYWSEDRYPVSLSGQEFAEFVRNHPLLTRM